ncbi:MAG: GNAT family N-acetyltransferase [Candidatus Heimdallarchaeota archaeon]|nr:GNAT family N-acetyltransferase [Candidatus Heimdallarchaeota archaeon]
MEIRRFTFEDKELFKIAYTIREEVFINEQKVDRELEFEFEEESTHYLLFVEGNAAATARWRETPKGIKLERFAVLKEYRKKGLGQMILTRILEDVLPFNKPVYLHSQAIAFGFYRKNGFEVIGNAFIEADIEHFMMVLKKR